MLITNVHHEQDQLRVEWEDGTETTYHYVLESRLRDSTTAQPRRSARVRQPPGTARQNRLLSGQRTSASAGVLRADRDPLRSRIRILGRQRGITGNTTRDGRFALR